MKRTVDILYYSEGVFAFYIRYENVPEWKATQMAKIKRENNWTCKVYINGQEVSE